MSASHSDRGRISIHAPRAGGDGPVGPQGPEGKISIHAPRAGGDFAGLAGPHKNRKISIHAPRAGGDDILSELR